MASRVSSIFRKEPTIEKLLSDTDELVWAWDQSSLSRGNILLTFTQFLTRLRQNYRSVRILDVQGRTGALPEHVLRILSEMTQTLSSNVLLDLRQPKALRHSRGASLFREIS